MAKGAVSVVIKGEYDSKDIDAAIRDLERMKKQSGSTQTGVGGLSSSLKGLAIAAAGAMSIGALVDFMKDAAGAAMEDEKSMVALATAMKNVGLASENAMAEDFIENLMLATGVADDELRPALQSLVTATGSLTTAQDALSLALDVSAGTGRSLSQTSQALVRAYSGQTTGLSRLGAGLDAALLKSKDMDAITGALSSKFGGQAAAAAETYAGKMQRVNVAVGEAKETIGYALLNALDDFAESMGGTDGAIGLIEDMGTGFGFLITGASDVASKVQGLVDQIRGLEEAENGSAAATENQGNALAKLAILIPVVGTYLSGLIYHGENVTETQEAAAGAITSAGSSASAASASFIKMNDSVSDAAVDAKSLRDAFSDLDSALALSQSRQDFNVYLDRLDEKLKGNARSFKGLSDSAVENKDSLRDSFKQAADLAQKWADENGKSVQEMRGYYDGLAAEIVNQFVADGFDRADVIKFLGSQGIWTEPGKEAGADLAAGVAAGLRSPGAIGAVTKASAQLARDTEAAFRAASETQSPSKVFARIGSDLAEGIIVGLDSKTEAVKEKSRNVAQGVIDAAREMIDGWDTELDRLDGIYQSAVDDFNNFKNQISGSIFGGLDLGAAVDEAEKTGGSVVEAFKAQAAGIGTFAQNMIDLTKTNLSQSAWMAIQALGADRGKDISTAMLGAQGQTIIDGINQVYADVEHMANAVGLMAAEKWKGEGVKQAQATYEGFRDNFGENGPARKALMNLMDGLSRAMDRTATITVTTVNRIVNEVIGPFGGARAMGGPVLADTAYLVGEQGPELFVPNSSGTIVPNGALPTARGGGGGAAAGATYAITVNAGVGDPRAIGQQVVEAITRYERANGPVYAKAS